LSPLRSDVLVMIRWEAGLVRGSQRRSTKSWKTTLGSQGTSSETSIVTAKKRFKLLFLRIRRRREMKLNQCATEWQWHCVLRNCSSALSKYSTLHIRQVKVWGEGADSQHDTLGGPAGSHTSQLNLTMGYRVSNKTGCFCPMLVHIVTVFILITVIVVLRARPSCCSTCLLYAYSPNHPACCSLRLRHSFLLLKVLVHVVVKKSGWQQKSLRCPTLAVSWCEHGCWCSPSTGHRLPLQLTGYWICF
jgi:hypothetical protein